MLITDNIAHKYAKIDVLYTKVLTYLCTVER